MPLPCCCAGGITLSPLCCFPSVPSCCCLGAPSCGCAAIPTCSIPHVSCCCLLPLPLCFAAQQQLNRNHHDTCSHKNAIKYTRQTANLGPQTLLLDQYPIHTEPTTLSVSFQELLNKSYHNWQLTRNKVFVHHISAPQCSAKSIGRRLPTLFYDASSPVGKTDGWHPTMFVTWQLTLNMNYNKEVML